MATTMAAVAYSAGQAKAVAAHHGAKQSGAANRTRIAATITSFVYSFCSAGPWLPVVEVFRRAVGDGAHVSVQQRKFGNLINNIAG